MSWMLRGPGSVLTQCRPTGGQTLRWKLCWQNVASLSGTRALGALGALGAFRWLSSLLRGLGLNGSLSPSSSLWSPLPTSHLTPSH